MSEKISRRALLRRSAGVAAGTTALSLLPAKPTWAEPTIPPADQTVASDVPRAWFLDEYSADRMKQEVILEYVFPERGPRCELVVQDLPAELVQITGVQVGDRVLGVDGRVFADFMLPDLAERARTLFASADSCVLHVQRSALRIDCALNFH